MSKVKKYVVAKYEYEYNDNWYDHNGNLETDNLLVFEDSTKAEERKKELTKEALGDYPAENNLSNIQDNIPNMSEIREFLGLEDDEDSWETVVDDKFLEGKKWDKLYTYIKDAFYKIIEIEVDINSPIVSIDWETDYYKNKITGIVEDDKLLLHSPTEPAFVQKDDYDTYERYYLKGEEYENVAKWKSDSRKYKIGNLLSEAETEKQKEE